MPGLPYGHDLADEPDNAAPVNELTADGERADRLLEREASWLQFNERVLELARDSAVPLLERVRFLSIFATNLDDFFMVRVAGLQRRVNAGLGMAVSGSSSPREQLEIVSQRAHVLVDEHARVFAKAVLPQLAAAGIELVRWAGLAEGEQATLSAVFRERIYPVLTPLAVDPAHPFPYISGLSLNLAVVVRDPLTGHEQFARVKVPPKMPRFFSLRPGRFVLLEDVIAAHLELLFPGMQIAETHTFRVTRNEDVEVGDDDEENLVKALERELLRRRFGPPVRLEVESSMSDRVLDLLTRELSVGAAEVYRVPWPLDLASLTELTELDRPELRAQGFVPTTHPRLHSDEGEQVDVFAAMRASDILVHHPYHSFTTSVEAFLEQAAADPAVLAVKQTLYRTSGDSPIVDALIDAAESGKQVLVLVEIQARFDEHANIRWARALEEAGCHVVYGLVGLKTHCKLSLAVREEADGSIRRYAHVGTGNYNPTTARIYEDLGLLTADPVVAADLTDLFNRLSGYSRRSPEYRRLLVAPDTLRSRLLEMIQQEADSQRAGREAGITIKVNHLVDEQVIDGLYAASRAGVPIDLVVRSICRLRPGVPGLSETIRVRSILGRFLEHSRVLRFRGGGQPGYWLGSADLMHRNLDRRIEAMVGIEDICIRRQLDELLDLATAPETDAWELQSNGSWIRTGDGRSYQDELIHRAQQRGDNSAFVRRAP